MHIGACEAQAVLAALAWCHVANLEVKDVKIRPDSKHPLEYWTESHRYISHVRLVRTTRQCLEEARSNFCVTFEHTKAHEGQWQNECADSLAKMGSYSFPAERTLVFSMAQWYETFQVPTRRVLLDDSNPRSVPFW